LAAAAVRGTCVVVVTHDQSLAALCEHEVRLTDGKPSRVR
jgi:predicted ABC-type transport system involved in lysophospholipase L1 biosynthesis ATPase subunit